MKSRLQIAAKGTAAVLKTIMAPQVGKDDMCDAIGYTEYAGDPTGNVTPDYIGQWCFDTAGAVFYRATTVTNTGWAIQYPGTISSTEIGYLDSVTAGTGAASKAVVLDASGNVTLPGNSYSAKHILVEDFDGTWAIGDAGPADLWSTTAGSGTATAVATTVAASLNGEVTLKSASDDGTHAANCSTFTAIGLAWRADSGGLAMEARLKISDVSEAVMFVGFTDTISTTVELPIFLVAADIDSDAANACGVGYDVDGTTKEFFHGGVKANVDTVPAYSGSAPADGVYFTVRVEVSAAGAVRGFINGTAIGVAVAAAVTATTALTPMIVIGNRSANQVTATIDYIRVEQSRIA